MKFCVVNAHLPNYEALAALTTYGNRTDYCKRHGYTLEVKTCDWLMPAVHPVSWDRMALIRDILSKPRFDWVWCSGTDTLNTNFNIRLEDLADDKFHVIASCEWCCTFQADSFLVRNSPEGRDWINAILSHYDEYKNDGWVEQRAILNTLPQFEGIVKILPQRAMNSYDYALYREQYAGAPNVQNGLDYFGNSGQWQPGDFLIHWPGISLVKRLELARKYLALVVK
jgi:hypothetical protein